MQERQHRTKIVRCQTVEELLWVQRAKPFGGSRGRSPLVNNPSPLGRGQGEGQL